MPRRRCNGERRGWHLLELDEVILSYVLPVKIGGEQLTSGIAEVEFDEVHL